jgi:ketosteroid isomerase-like protein
MAQLHRKNAINWLKKKFLYSPRINGFKRERIHKKNGISMQTDKSIIMTQQTRSSIETVKKMYALFATKDNNKIREIFDENIKWNQMKGFPKGGQFIGADAIFENVFDGFRKNWTDWRAIITRYIDSGDGVFVIGFYEGTFNATGIYMKSEFACEYKVRNGKITEFNQYTDTFLIGWAMGLTKE